MRGVWICGCAPKAPFDANTLCRIFREILLSEGSAVRNEGGKKKRKTRERWRSSFGMRRREEEKEEGERKRRRIRG